MSSQIDKILEYLYIGNYYSALDKNIITNYDIGTIVNCTTQREKLNVNNYLQVSINDPPTLSDINYLNKNFMIIANFIEKSIKNKINVLVHCLNGSQRSATVVATYLIIRYKLNPNNCINFIKSKRPICFFGSVNYHKSLAFIYNKVDSYSQLKVLRELSGEKNNTSETRKEFDKIFFNPNINPERTYKESKVAVMDIGRLEATEMMGANGFNPLMLVTNNDDLEGKIEGFKSNLDREDGSFCYYRKDALLDNNDKNNSRISTVYTVLKVYQPADDMLPENEFNKILLKLETVFQVGKQKGHDSIILFDWGTNLNLPLDKIVEISNRCLERWKSDFKMIIFAIRPQSSQYGNFQYFKTTLEN